VSAPAAPVASVEAAQHALTSCMWLEGDHVGYLGPRNSPAIHRLEIALARMSFDKAKFDLGVRSGDYINYLSDLVKSWNPDMHQSMRDFLTMGGYEGQKERLITGGAKPAPVTEKPVKKPSAKKVRELEEQARQTALAQEEAELERLVDAELLNEDPRAGSW
jgi:hypothetical protein